MSVGAVSSLLIRIVGNTESSTDEAGIQRAQNIREHEISGNPVLDLLTGLPRTLADRHTIGIVLIAILWRARNFRQLFRLCRRALPRKRT
jgi:hypothetical protein